MEQPDWFEAVHGPDVLQGDLLFHCPVFTLADDIPFPVTEKAAPAFFVDQFDLAIMTHELRPCQ